MKQPFLIWAKSRLINIPRIFIAAAAWTVCLPLCAARATEKIAVFPNAAYDACIIYQNLAIFWFFIIGLIVIIGMKLKEIDRIQKLGIDRDDENAPRLD
ncbi:MAG: hypothetical protein JW943_09775 [Deltaproteobacteria bacterium]|nr:hypothetical protein [Deltaproteobacteria bacterium]